MGILRIALTVIILVAAILRFALAFRGTPPAVVTIIMGVIFLITAFVGTRLIRRVARRRAGG
jgi:drug/metabolite transporter (DMT)-like permease